MSEYEIKALGVEAQQRVLALREAKNLLTRRRSVPVGVFGMPERVEEEISAVDLVTVASYIVTGEDPWETTPVREQVELEAAAEALREACADDEYDVDEEDPEPTPTEARIGNYVSRTAELEEIARASTVVEHRLQSERSWQPGPLPDTTHEFPAVDPEPTFDQVLGASDQQDREAWS